LPVGFSCYCTPFFKGCKPFFYKKPNFYKNFLQRQGQNTKKSKDTLPKSGKHGSQQMGSSQFPQPQPQQKRTGGGNADLSRTQTEAIVHPGNQQHKDE